MACKGELRMWIARDPEGGIHDDMDHMSSYFMIISDPYEDDLGRMVVDFMEDGTVFIQLDVEHIDHWSLLVSDPAE